MQQLTLGTQLQAEIVTQLHERQRHPAGAPAEPAHCPALVRFHLSVLLLGQQRNQILSRHGLEIVHLPFQIHPDIPPEGVEAGPRDGPMYQALEREAAQTGLSLNWPPRLPGTRTALAAAEWVRRRRPDASDEFNRALFAAHFELSEDLGDTAVIMRQAG